MIVCLSAFVYELDSRVDQNDLFWYETSTNQIAAWIQDEKRIKMICFVWLKSQFFRKNMEIFFLEFFKSLSDTIFLKMKKTSKKIGKNDLS